MPSHPDRVRRNYMDVTILTWKSTIDHDEKYMLHIKTADIASCITKHELAQMIVKKVYDAVMMNG